MRRHFQCDWAAVAEVSPDYGRYVESERVRLGENHPLFLTQYALKTVSGGRLFSAGQRAQLQGEHSRQATGVRGESYVAGLDVGGQQLDGSSEGAHDPTVLTVARVVSPPADALVKEPRLEVVEHVCTVGERHDELFPRLVDLLGRVWRVRRVAVDATGLGETLARLLARTLGPSVVKAVRFTAEVKSRLGYDLLAAVNGGRLRAYAADGSGEHAEFRRQLELARVAYRPSRTMNFFVEASEGHDDYLISLALAVEAARDLDPRPRVARGRSRSEGLEEREAAANPAPDSFAAKRRSPSVRGRRSE